MEQGKILSIRLSPDGLSFWTTALAANQSKDAPARRDLWSQGLEKALSCDPALSTRENTEQFAAKIRACAGGDFTGVEILPDTLSNVPVPQELLGDGDKAAYFAANDITLHSGEAIFSAEVSPEIVSLIAYDAAAIRMQNEIWGRECTLRSPFAVGASFITKYGSGRRRTAAIYLTPRHAYISVFEKLSGAVLYMDTLNWVAEADLLYAITLLDKRFDLKKSKIYIKGTQAEQVRKLLRRYYRKSRCE